MMRILYHNRTAMTHFHIPLQYLCTVSKSVKQNFKAEFAEAYNRMAKNHEHPDGPWVKITKEALNFTSSGTILDLASGPGQPGAMIARAMPNSLVIATDISDEMIITAHEVHKSIPNLVIKKADMVKLDEFEDGVFDVVTCCYGYMFVQDSDKALQETFRVLKRGGVLLATTW